jgi:hypothetical protein
METCNRRDVREDSRHSEKEQTTVRIIQLLEAEFHHLLRIAFARNITKLARDNEGVVSNHQYGRSHNTCISPILNKLLTIQLLIQKKVNGIVFDNYVKGCYAKIISGISLVTLRRCRA